MCECPDRVPKFRRRMFHNGLILVIDPPGFIEELSDFDLSLGIGASAGTGRQTQNQTPNPNTVIVAHNRAIDATELGSPISLHDGTSLSHPLVGNYCGPHSSLHFAMDQGGRLVSPSIINRWLAINGTKIVSFG
jgi:hypothetical protein